MVVVAAVVKDMIMTVMQAGRGDGDGVSGAVVEPGIVSLRFNHVFLSGDWTEFFAFVTYYETE